MLGYRYIKANPNSYLALWSRGAIRREGIGIDAIYFAPQTTVIRVPIGTREFDFMFEHMTADFQHVTVQGQATYQVVDPRRLAGQVNHAINPRTGAYMSDDPAKVPRRILRLIDVAMQRTIQGMDLRQAVRSAGVAADAVAAELRGHGDMTELGLAVQSVSVLAIKPVADTARALEAEAREAILKAADEAVFTRRNAAVANERAIRENELDTEIAVEHKLRAKREAEMAAEAAIQEQTWALRAAELETQVTAEARRKDLVALQAANTRVIGEAEASKVKAIVEALHGVDPRIVQAITASGMDAAQLIAQAFTGIAERAERIGQLNVSPELLNALIKPPMEAAS